MDKEVRDFIKLEQDRQNNGIELIASENYASKEVREMMASILTNKYAEGRRGRSRSSRSAFLCREELGNKPE